MFKLFGSPSVKCPRCGHKSSGGANSDVGYCSSCGVTLVSRKYDPTFSKQRWEIGHDELALFFSVRQLKSIFFDGLHIAPALRACIFQGEKVTDIAAGDYGQEGFFAQRKTLLREAPAEILITRQHAFPVKFSVDDVHTAEFLALAATFSIHFTIEQADAFARYFMSAPGTITSRHLQDLLLPTVRQAVAQFIGAQSLRELHDNANLCQQLNERIESALRLSIAQYGLGVTQVSTLTVRHDQISSKRENLSEKVASLFLVSEEKNAANEHSKRLDALYSTQEWQKISREEEQVRLRYRREELRQKFGKDLGWLYLQGQQEDAKRRLSRAKLVQDETERLQAIRERELELYGRIADAATRKEAIERGAGESVKELEHTLAKNSTQREHDADQWAHVRTMARIKMRTESEITQVKNKAALHLMQQRINQQLQKISLQHEMEQARQIEDQEQQRVQTDILRQHQENLARREQELAEEEQKNQLLSISIVTEAKAREFQRLQAWEEELQLQRKRALLREESVSACDNDLQVAALKEKVETIKRAGIHQDALAQNEKLLRTIETHGIFERQTQRQRNQAQLDDLAVEENSLRLRRQDDEARWQRELQASSAERADQRNILQSEQAHEALLARIAIERISAIAGFSETGKIATADGPNASALAEILKIQAQATMSTEQILASQASLSHHTALDRQREDRQQREREAERERRHQLDLTIAQNGANNRADSSDRSSRK